MWLRLRAMTKKEFIHIRRDPRSLAIMIFLPLVQLVLLGYAATTDIKNLNTAVVDSDKTPQSRELVDAYRASDYFYIVDYVDNEEEAGRLLDAGTIRAAVIIPAGYGKDLTRGQRPEVAFFIDGSDPQIANTVFAASQSVAQAQSTDIIRRTLNVDPANLPGIDVRPRVWYNPNMESAYFTIPGLIGIILFLFAALFTSMSIVREREQGTIEQLIVTPLRPTEMILAKIIPYIIISFLDVLEVLALGVWLFHIPINGSLELLLLISGLFLILSLSIGILISSVAGTQQEAMMMTLGMMLPNIFLSGMFFPIEAMPKVLQYISYLVPVRYMINVLRSIILKGVGVQLLLNDLWAMAAMAAVVVTVASISFKKRLD